MESYLKARLLKYAENGESAAGRKWSLAYQSSLYIGSATEIDQLGPNLFAVPSSQSNDHAYFVDTLAGVCECMAGRHGSYCKHQCAVYRLFGSVHFAAPVLDTAQARHNIAVFASGDSAPPQEFYGPLTENWTQTSPAIQRRGRRSLRGRGRLIHNIKVQPTAMYRRRSTTSRRGQPLRAGRPRGRRTVA